MQYLFSPPREASDSEREEEMNEEEMNEEENTTRADSLSAKSAVSRRRRKETLKLFKGAE